MIARVIVYVYLQLRYVHTRPLRRVRLNIQNMTFRYFFRRYLTRTTEVSLFANVVETSRIFFKVLAA